MSAEPEFPMISAAEDVSCGIGSDCEITLVCNNKHFIVLLSRCSSGNDNSISVEEHHLRKPDDALKSKDFSQIDAAIDEVSNFIASICQPMFRKFASVIDKEPEELYLDSCLNPETIRLRVVTEDRESKVIEFDDHTITNSTAPGLHLQKIAMDLDLPKFSPEQVKVLEKYQGTNILKVSVCDQVMSCKVANDLTRPAIDRELRCLQQILAADLDPVLRIPKLCGIIVSGNDNILGILMTNITPNAEIPRLGLVDTNTVEVTRRNKWASQIEDLVEKLHNIGVIWGDAKADNILIDSNDDLWMIDFGGGWTENWVHPDLADSVEGDLQGLKSILHFLKL